ncbi:MAG: ABC transporter ATP-binding protein/permease [Patescibacteria group bacterium]|nr:ABC transporter ATP-binding protein/permease [Patescibacteria group bacterium]
MRNIANIIRISKPLRYLVWILSGLILVSSALALVAPILSKSIVDQIVAQIGHKGGNAQRLILLIFIAFGANLLSLILNTVSGRIGDHFAGRLRQFLTEKFYDKVLTLPQSYFDSSVSGKIVNQLARGIQSIQTFLNAVSNFILPTFLQSIFTILVLAHYNIPIALFTFILFPVYLVLSYYSTVRWGREEVKKNQIEDASRGRIQEVIANMPLVKGFISEIQEFKTLSRNLTEINRIYAKQSTTYHVFDFFRGLSLNIILFVINLVVFYSTFKGHLSIGEMVLILQLVNQARIPLFAMSFILTQIQMAESGSKEYFEILRLPSKENYKIQTPLERAKNPTIRFRDVSFRYENSENVLKNVSFSIRSKEKVALVGHSGAGKTTIVNLLLKFYEPSEGAIYLKNEDYKNLEARYIRHNIALVFQENELFSSTVKENVAYGNPDASKEKIISALKLANAFDFVQRLPSGIRSRVGERGVRLSGGQKQRIQIARAILKDAPILILDEATSSLDAKSEKEVQDALQNLMKDRLVIIIAHRFTTIQNVEKILVIDKGTIVDSGPPRELAKKKGIYSSLLRYQVEGNRKLLESFEIY